MSRRHFTSFLRKTVTLATFVGISIIGGTAIADTSQWEGVFAPFDCTGADCIEVGTAQLIREDDRVSVSVLTTELENNAGYTIWWVVFNNPEECSGGACGEDDVIDDLNGVTDAVDISILWAAGEIANSNGTANFAATLFEGETVNVAGFGASGDDGGLDDAFAAEIHIVVRSHGGVNGNSGGSGDTLYDVLSTFGGGCFAGPAANNCADQQFAVFTP